MSQLMQIASGHLRLADGGWEALPCPRLEALADALEERGEKSIVWCQWQPDVEQLVQVFRRRGIHGVTYYGGNSKEQNARNLARWRTDARAQVFLATPKSAGTGLTLNEASATHCFSHGTSYLERDQQLLRNWREGQDKAVTFTDWYTPGTLDHKLLKAYESKAEVAALFRNPATFAQWLQDDEE